MLDHADFFRNVVEQAAASIFIIDGEHCIVFQNYEARKCFGYAPEEIIGHSIFEKICSQDAQGQPVHAQQSPLYKALALAETTRDFVCRMSAKDGSARYASCSIAPLVVDGKQRETILLVTDITDRKLAEQASQKYTDLLQLTADIAGVGFFDYYPQTNELNWSDNVKRHFGLPPDAQITLDTFFAGLHPDDRAPIRAIQARMVDPESGGNYQYEYRTIGLADGKERWIAAQGKFFYEDGKPVHQIGATLDITERKRTEEGLRQAAHHCSLTGLPNRAMLTEYADHLLAMAERDSAESAVLFVDLDRFKPINDLYGHEVGDKVLQEVAHRLRLCMRKEDIVSRLGGDEFVILLPHVDNAIDPQTVAQHILDKIGKPFQIGTLQLNISPSIGISMFPKHGKNIETLIHCADLAMYAAKSGGRNNFKVYIPGFDERANRQLQLEMHLKNAMESNAMALFYQPIIDIETGQLVSVEALLRLVGENGNLLLPNQFVQIAETAGLIEKIGHWVAHEACRQHQAWRSAGLPALSIAINVSALEFRQHAFIAHLVDALKASDMDPACLQIELTERAVMDNIAASIATLNQLRALGIRISLDDFGTGYSSLSYLSSLPLDKLKIDQSFIRKLDTSAPSQSIIDTILALGHSMKLQVVGEGIESEPAMEYLRSHGCDQAQGFLFSKPLPAHEFESWYRARTRSLH